MLTASPNEPEIGAAVDEVYTAAVSRSASKVLKVAAKANLRRRREEINRLARAYTFSLVPRPAEWRCLPVEEGKTSQAWIPKQLAAKPQWKATHTVKKVTRRRRYRAQGGRCFYCRKVLDRSDEGTLDHLIPNVLVRTYEPRNLVLTCTPCNEVKGDQILAVLMPLLSVVVATQARLIQQARDNERSLVLVGRQS